MDSSAGCERQSKTWTVVQAVRDTESGSGCERHSKTRKVVQVVRDTIRHRHIQPVKGPLSQNYK